MSESGSSNGYAAERFPPLPDPLPVHVFDSHCHLDMLDVPVEEALAAAKAVGVTRIVTIGCDLASSRFAADAAAEHDDVYAGVAIHPNETTGISDAVLDDVAKLAALPRVRAVGETGLDYYRDWAPKDDQHRSFRGHIDIAKRTGKALVIHDREAHDDVLRILREEGAPEYTVLHCFSGDIEMARECLDAGYYLSFSGTVTFKNARGLRDALSIVPPERVLVETDAPYLTPSPHRGAVNAPYLIPVTVRAMAEVLNLDVPTLCRHLSDNAERIYGPW